MRFISGTYSFLLISFKKINKNCSVANMDKISGKFKLEVIKKLNSEIKTDIT